MKSRRILLPIFLLVLTYSGFSQIRLPALISDNMVLQRNAELPLWGWSSAGEKVTIETDWDGQRVETRAGADGKWLAMINTPDAGGPYSISFIGKEKTQVKNILIGEVWLCSGQSNMEMPVEGWENQPVTGSEATIRDADFPDIRLFTVERKVAYEPQTDCNGNWTSANSESVAKFSAAGYYFGLRLYKQLKIPIGLIHSSWGGTPAEAWTSQEFIDKIPYFHTNGERCEPKVYTQRKVDAHALIQKEWLNKLGFLGGEPGNETVAPAWALIDFDDSSWEETELPGNWADTEVGHYEGAVELRLEVKIPGSWKKKETILDLGPIDEMDVVWVNGVKVGEHLNVYDWPTFRSYKIPAGVLKKGKNIIAVKVANTSGIGGVNGEAAKMKLYPDGKQTIWEPLAGIWKYRKAESFSNIEPLPWCDNCGEPHTPTTLYNGMIAPLIPFKIKGAIWYQGESNRYDGKLYGKIFPNMIQNWRDDWGQGDFPFYYVQISPYSYTDKNSTGLLREAQLDAMKMPNTGMVVTMDVGSLRTIHPPDKKTVGERLAGWALAKDYGFKNLQYSGPLYKKYEVEGDKIRIFFNYTCGGLRSQGGPLTHFTIAGADGKFVEATAVIEKNTVVVYSDAVRNPKAVRFGWESTDMTNLFNMAGLPASPFRTDNY